MLVDMTDFPNGKQGDTEARGRGGDEVEGVGMEGDEGEGWGEMRKGGRWSSGAGGR